MDEVVLQKPLPLAHWGELIGHEQERSRLIRGGSFPSLLFSGPPGLGKRLVGAWFAAFLNRELSEPDLGADDCTSRLILRNQHPDLVWLERVPGKLSLGVGEARELIQQLYLRPYQARSRVCIISEAERLTEEAQSALLKTLEEPPDHNVLILVTNQEARLLPTVTSRCRIHRFRPVDDGRVSQWLQTKGCPAQTAQGYAAVAQGCPGQALRFWEHPTLWEAQEQLLDSLDQLPGIGLGRSLELAARCEALKVPGFEGREQLEWLLDCSQAYLRDALLLAHGSLQLVYQHRRAPLEKLAQQPQRLPHCLAALQESRDYLQANVNSRLLVQDLFLKLRR